MRWLGSGVNDRSPAARCGALGGARASGISTSERAEIGDLGVDCRDRLMRPLLMITP